MPPNAQGFSLQAEVRLGINQRKKLEHLCRARPAIANEGLTLNRGGDVVLQLKSRYHDGTTHIVMSPLEFMQRLAALVPRPIRFSSLSRQPLFAAPPDVSTFGTLHR